MGLRAWALIAVVAAGLRTYARDLQQPGDYRRELPRAAGNQFDPVTASDGRDFIAVWRDTNAGFQIYMNIVRRDGEVLASAPVLLCASQHRCGSPAVVWNGKSYLVAWITADNHDWEISLVRVSPDGNVLGASTIFTSSESLSGLSMASNGVSSLVIATIGGRLRILALDTDAKVVDTIDRGILTSTTRLIAQTDRYILVYASQSYSGLTTSEITFDGKRLSRADDQYLDSAVDSWTLSTGSDGDRGLIVYTTTENYTQRIFARLVTNGKIGPRVEIGTGDLVKNPTGGAFAGYTIPILSTSVAANRTGFTAAWSSRADFDRNPVFEESKHHSVGYQPYIATGTFDIEAATIDTSGKLRNRFTLVAGEWSDETPSIAANDSQVFVLWTEMLLRYPSARKIAAGISDSQHGAAPVEIAHTRPLQDSPRIAAGPNGYVVVWREEPQNDGLGTIMAQRRDRDGNALEAPRRVSNASDANSSPRVAFNGHEYLIAWIDQIDTRWFIVGRRMMPDGTFVDAQPVFFTYETFFGLSFGLASNGTGFAIAYLPYAWSSDLVWVQTLSDKLEFTGGPWIEAGNDKINPEVVIAAAGHDYVIGWQTGKYPQDIRNSAVAAASASAPQSVRRVESLWYTTPVMACGEHSCLALTYRSYEDRTLIARPFHPLLDVPAASNETALPWSVDARLTSRGSDFLAVGRLAGTDDARLRARYLAEDGAPLSGEIEVANRPFIGELDTAMLDDGFAVAYTAPGVDGALRVFVEAVKRSD